MVENNVNVLIESNLKRLKVMAEHTFGLTLTDEKLVQFSRYASLLLAWNQQMNLTAITDPEGITVKHFLDSLVFVPWLKQLYPSQKVLLADLGTGAGFPGIPINILLPEIHVVLIDSLSKRINFLKAIIQELGLTKIEAIHTRAEDIGRAPSYRGCFDVVTARAVAELPILLEYAIPLLKVGGRLIAAKGMDPDTEIKSAQKALSELNSELEIVQQYSLAEGADHRSLIIIKKKERTPEKYPRAAGKPKKNPL